MLQQQVQFLTTILLIVDSLSIIAAGYGAYFYRVFTHGGGWSMDTNLFAVSVLVIMGLNSYMLGKFGLYSDRRPRSYASMLWSIVKALLVSFGALALGIFIFQQKQYSRIFFAGFALLSLVLVVFFRTLFQLYFGKVARQDPYSHKILLVGTTRRCRFVQELLKGQLSWGHEVIGHIEVDEHVGIGRKPGCSAPELERTVREKTVDEVIFAMDGDRKVPLSQCIATCRRIGVACRILPAMWMPHQGNISIESCQGVPFLTLRTDSFNAAGLVYKRMLDLVGGFIGTLVLLILYPFVALAIKIDSPGPVIFHQKRVGKHGRVFELYKFRTMYRDAESHLDELKAKNQMNGAMFKMKNDPRITRVGRWLRKTSIDEVPQFWNVLRGDMSLVGTRPPTLHEVETYKPEHLKRISAKPGITGMWQVSGRNKIIDFETVVELDCRYLENWRFWDDIKILAKTILVVLQRKGAI